MVLCSVPSVPRIEVHVDDTSPDAWRHEPYYGDLQRWSAAALPANSYVMVYLPDRVIVILPHKHVDLGKIAPDSQIKHVTRITAQGPLPEVELVTQS
jgi:hypothetical protein